MSSSQRSKWINDPIHGHFQLKGVALEYIDTPQFQRLRDLKQLGASYLVFPGASHNRFEHSLGTSYLANILITRFQKDQPELEINERDVKCVTLAGLVHDLGHGPLSHFFDAEFIPAARPGIQWSHEIASERMLDYLIEDNGIEIAEDDLKFVKDLIQGIPRSQRSEKKYLFEIVANKKNSIDVDKFDYIQRDCYNTGIKSSYDASRLMTFSRVIDDQICYKSSELYNLCELFHTRYSLFKRVYTHKVAKACEYMMRDALLAADDYLHISSSIDYMPEYMNITDSILREIERSKCPELEKSRNILTRIRRRDLYTFVDEQLLPSSEKSWFSITSEEIASCRENIDDFDTDDVLVEVVKYNYASGNQSPFDSIRAYSKFDDKTSIPVAPSHVSFLIPEEYEEILIRIYTKHAEKAHAVQKAFRKRREDILNEIGLRDLAYAPNTRKQDNMSLSPTKTNFKANYCLTVPQSPRKRRHFSDDNFTFKKF